MPKTSNIPPKRNNFLLGHKEAEAVFLNSWKNGSLHNSWLLCGEKGIGKATFAYKIIKFLLSVDEEKKEKYISVDIDTSNPVIFQIEEGSCYNLKVIECDYVDEDKRKIIKAIRDGNPLGDDDLENLRKSSVIKVDEVRTINEFMAKKTYDNNWKIVLIDSVDDMNLNSANALLKILEEPPAKSIFILISHNPNKLLPTIKSRCNRLNLSPLQENEIASLLRRYRPDLGESEIKKIASVCDGSIGKALVYVDADILKYYDMLNRIIYSGKNFKISDMLEFVDMAVQDDQSWELSQDVIIKLLSENIKSGENVEELIEIWQDSVRMFEDTQRINMDRKNTLITIIYRICNVF